MKIKKEMYSYSCDPIDYVILHLSKPIPHNYMLKDSRYWPIGINNLRAPSIFNGRPIPKGLEQAQKLREMIKKTQGVKAVYVEEYEVLLEISPAIQWKDISEQIKLTIRTFFNEEKIIVVS